MPIIKYKLIEKEIDGKIEKIYYSIDTDEYIEADQNEQNKYLYYDTYSKKALSGKELEKFLQNNPDFLYDENVVDEDELDESKDYDVNVMFIHAEENEAEKNRIRNKYNFVFENVNMADISNLKEGMKLDPSKRYQDQIVDQKMFNKAVKFQYQEAKYGHNIIREDFSYIGISGLFKSTLLKLGYQLYLKNDEDLTFKDQEKKDSERNNFKKEYFNQIENEADEMDLDDNERDIYINKRKIAYEKKYEYLIYNNIKSYGLLNDSDYELRAKVDENAELANPEKEMPLIEAAKLGVIATLLGNGDPRLAFTQFLDKDALKDNEYKFDEKAIDNFIKEIKISEKEKEDMVYSAFDHQAFYTLFSKAKEDRKTHEYSFKDVVKLGKDIIKDDKNHSDKYYADAGIEYKKQDNYVSENLRILKVAKLYNDMKFIRSKKPWYYVIAHPIKAYMEYKCKNEIENYIKDNITPDTDFEKKINSYLKSSVKDQNKFYKEALDATKEPFNNPIYENYEIALDKMDFISDYDDAQYTKEEQIEKGLINVSEQNDKKLLDIKELDDDQCNINNKVVSDDKSLEVMKENEQIIEQK